MAKAEAVQVTHLEDVQEVQAEEWPAGSIFVRALELAKTDELDDDMSTTNNPGFWQASARYALLKKYGYIESREDDDLSNSASFIETVTSRWMSVLQHPASDDKNDDDLVEFLRTGESNGRKLQFNLMFCEPGCRVRLLFVG